MRKKVKREESSLTQSCELFILRVYVIVLCAAQSMYFCVYVCMCVTPRHGALSATRGPCCRLLAYPRILLGASHTWVAHSSWALHIQIAVMNIIRGEHRGDVQGTHTHTHTQSYVSAQTHMSAHTQMSVCSILSCIQNMIAHMHV